MSRDFDATRGFPGEGPEAVARGPGQLTIQDMFAAAQAAGAPDAGEADGAAAAGMEQP